MLFPELRDISASDRAIFQLVREPTHATTNMIGKVPLVCIIYICVCICVCVNSRGMFLLFLSVLFLCVLFRDCDYGDRDGGSVIGVITTARVLYS